MSNDTQTLSLVDFLLARIAEDEEAADLVLRPYGDHASTNDAEWWGVERNWFRHGLSSDETPLLMRMTPQRVLAECEAKRWTIRAFQKANGLFREGIDGYYHYAMAYRQALLQAAAVYAAHPDYREEWKP